MDNVSPAQTIESNAQVAKLRDECMHIERGLLLSEIGGKTSNVALLFESVSCLLNGKGYDLAKQLLSALGNAGLGNELRFCRLDYLTAACLNEKERAASALAKLNHITQSSDWIRHCLTHPDQDFRQSILQSNKAIAHIESVTMREGDLIVDLGCNECHSKSRTIIKSIFSSELNICENCAEPRIICAKDLAPLLIGQIDKRARNVLDLCEKVRMG